MSRIALTLMAALLISGCGQTIERMQRKAQAKEIVERTITTPTVSYVTIEKPKRLPDELLVPCGITYRQNFRVGEYVRVADTNTAYLEACKKQVDEIIKLQPAK